MKKYQLLKDDTKQVGSRTLYRIRSIVAFGIVANGDLGGYVESESNLSHNGNARVSGNARVYGATSIVWFSCVGSENGTLTVCKSKTGLFVSRGCFSGIDAEFLSRVDKAHGADSRIGREYHMLIEVARSRINGESK